MKVRASDRNLSMWSGTGAYFGRYDYRSEDHRLTDMLTDEYFGNCWQILKCGDFVTLIDCEDQIMTVRIDYVDRHAQKVLMSKIERLYAMPVVETSDPEDPGLVWKWRARNGGGHSIVTKKGEIVAINFGSRELADQAIALMYKTKIFIAPVGHEPLKQFVKETPIWRGD